jgi:hypothetical protein
VSAGRFRFAVDEHSGRTAMPHKFNIGAMVHYEGGSYAGAARGIYKVTRQLPVENDNKILYRIKSQAETFERTAEEHQLSRAG